MIVTLAFEPFECPTDTFGNSLLEFETIVTFGVVLSVMVIVVFRPPFQWMPFESDELVVIVAKPLADDDDDHDDEDE